MTKHQAGGRRGGAQIATLVADLALLGTPGSITEPLHICASTLRVRRYRERRREGLCLLANLADAISRQLLKAEDRVKAWPVIQACYGAELSDAALDWLINGDVITREHRTDAVAILRSIGAWLERAG